MVFKVQTFSGSSPFGLNGDEGNRTPDPLLARQVLSQLSYTPLFRSVQYGGFIKVGLSGLEPPTSRLSGVRSNRLSYKPKTTFISYGISSALLSGSGSHLLSHAVPSIVPWAVWVLTIVFGMGTGVAPRRIATGSVICPIGS